MRIDPAAKEQETIDRIADLSGMTVLEVGGGDGRLTATLARKAASVLSIDPDAELVAKARRASDSEIVDHAVDDIVTFDSAPGTFDAVVLALSL